MGHSLVPIRITARVIRRFQNNIFRRTMINMAEGLRVHSLIARAALHSRASAGCNFGQTAGPSLIKFGTREGGREGRGGEGRGGEGRGGEGRGGEGRGGEGRGGEGRGGEGRGAEGRGGEGTVHTFHKPEPLWPRSLAGHTLRGWPASEQYIPSSLSKMTIPSFGSLLCRSRVETVIQPLWEICMYMYSDGRFQ